MYQFFCIVVKTKDMVIYHKIGFVDNSNIIQVNVMSCNVARHVLGAFLVKAILIPKTVTNCRKGQNP